MFDPVTGKVTDPEALRSLQFNGQGMRVPRTVIRDGKKLTEVIHSDDGGTAAVLTEHGSGRVDVNAIARAAAVTTDNP